MGTVGRASNVPAELIVPRGGPGKLHWEGARTAVGSPSNPHAHGIKLPTESPIRLPSGSYWPMSLAYLSITDCDFFVTDCKFSRVHLRLTIAELGILNTQLYSTVPTYVRAYVCTHVHVRSWPVLISSKSTRVSPRDPPAGLVKPPQIQTLPPLF